MMTKTAPALTESDYTTGLRLGRRIDRIVLRDRADREYQVALNVLTVAVMRTFRDDDEIAEASRKVGDAWAVLSFLDRDGEEPS